ncbi:hypothetical protein C1645_832487 [Glomus cerebriforme]|uniref:Ion transport domain-containing protein n=1 Tax=Glomus cerebriforme TaxID=658196 RepID=A0A397SE72_9GLOM|nr:hypothetical protein C1645_832487 [Glomus cerebriforme]
MDEEIIQIDDKDNYDNELGIDDEIVSRQSRNLREPHDGNKISLVSISPSGTYVITYSSDDKSIEGWTVEDSKITLESRANVYKLPKESVPNESIGIKVNDNKIVCYTWDYLPFIYLPYYKRELLEIFRMSDEYRPIKIKYNQLNISFSSKFIYFKKNGSLVMLQASSNKRYHRFGIQNYINNLLVYSPHDEIIDKLILISSHKLLGRIEDIDVDENNIWAISSNYLFQWDSQTLQLISSYYLGFTPILYDDIYEKSTIISKGNSLVVNYHNEIVIFSVGKQSPVRNIRIENSITKVELLCNNDYLLAFNLPKDGENQNIFLYDIRDVYKQPVDVSGIFNKDNSENRFILYEYNSESNEAFGLVDGIHGKISCINLSNMKWNEVFDHDDIVASWNTYLNDLNEKKYCNDTLIFPDANKIRSLFSEEKKDLDKSDETQLYNFEEKSDLNHSNKLIDIDFEDKKYKWRINIIDDKYNSLSVCNDKELLVLDSKKIIPKLKNWKILYNNALALRDKFSLIIFEYDIDNKRIKSKYWYSQLRELKIQDFCGSILPIIDVKDFKRFKYDYKKVFKLNYGTKHEYFYDEWINTINNFIEDDKCLAKYGPTLFPILIKSNDPKLTYYIEPVYTKCIKLVKEDPKRNLKFLNIITLSMKYLYKKYPDYLTKFNSEMFMFLDPSDEKINNNKYYSHFYTFSTFNQEIEIYKTSKLLSQLPILSKLTYFEKLHDRNIIIIILGYVFFLLFSFIILLSMTIWSILVSIASIIILPFMPLKMIYKSYLDRRKANQYVVFIVPYIKYSCYPLKYSWWKEIFYPQPSEFVKDCEKEFYTNWNGEAIINFKWEKFGRAYYFAIWLIFIVFLVCFTIASYPTNSISQEIRIKLHKTSIAFGIFHLIFELRQFIWRPITYVISIWNLFDLSAFLSATITSIYWIKYDDVPDWALSVSCLLLDMKFILFFRIFESFGVYFAIIFGVAKRVFSFLLVLAMIIASFAHAFFLLLHPQNLLDSLKAPNSSDPNNPWTLTNIYNQTDENGNVKNEAFIQVPSENTNLFYSYPTSLLAIYLFLTGNQNSLSPWTPTPSSENTILFILIVIFSFLIVIYLMNLFIGLLNMAIEKENDRASYLVQKAEVIAEIELFYLFPRQRRHLKSWFPEVIHYAVDVKEARIYIKKAIEKGDWKNDDWPEMKNKILKLLNIEEAIKS